MEEAKERITEYAEIIAPEINDEGLLAFVVDDVVNRFLVYTNRIQRLETEDAIPGQLETILATAAVGAYRNAQEIAEADTGAVSSVKDGDQSVSFSETLVSYLRSSSDAEIFSGVYRLIDKFRIPTIPSNEDTE